MLNAFIYIRLFLIGFCVGHVVQSCKASPKVLGPSSTLYEPSIAVPPPSDIPDIPSARPTPVPASAPDLPDSAAVPALQSRVAAAARRGPAAGADYGKVPERALEMPRSFETRPFGDLEPGTTNEDEPPAQTMPSDPILEVVQRAIENAREAEKHLD